MKTKKPARLFAQTSTTEIAARLRELRKKRGWSLAEVEKISRGSIKAVVLGSYERSDRSLSVARAIQLADLYGVPLAHLLCAVENHHLDFVGTRIVVDLHQVASTTSFTSVDKERMRILNLFIAWIAGLRSDWNGQVLSLRRSDISTLALLAFAEEKVILDWLVNQKLILIEPTRL